MLGINFGGFLRALRKYSKKTDCDWEKVIKDAACKTDPVLMSSRDTLVQLKLCKSPEAKHFEAPVEINLSSINGVLKDAYEQNIVIIKKSPKHCMQSGTANIHTWLMTFYTNNPNWENPLMGWTSGNNSQKDVEMNFPCKVTAVRFAQRQGWNYILLKEEEKPKTKVKSYAMNFSWDRRSRVSTK